MYKNIHKFNDDGVARIIRDVKEKIHSNVRDKLILRFLFDIGIRVGDLCNIKNEDVTYKQIKICYLPNKSMAANYLRGTKQDVYLEKGEFVFHNWRI